MSNLQESPTGTMATRVIGFLAIVVVGFVVVSGLFLTPSDAIQGDAVRIMYVHVPSAWVAYLAFVVTAVSSAAHLTSKKIGFDHFAGASAEVGVFYMGVSLVTGSLWGRLTWGEFWQWDPRLTTTVFLLVTYIGYLAVRNLDGAPLQRARRSAIVALLAVLEIPLVHFSVVIWRSLHQRASVLDADVKMDDLMLFTLFAGVVGFTLTFSWLVLHRQRTMYLMSYMEEQGLDQAIATRIGAVIDPMQGSK